MTPDQSRRLRDCACDEDITHILDNARRWFEDDSAEALVQRLEDIRDILTEDASQPDSPEN